MCDPNHGIHIWDYEAKVSVEFENTDGKKYYTKSYFNLSQVRKSAIPLGPGDLAYKGAKSYLETKYK